MFSKSIFVILTILAAGFSLGLGVGQNFDKPQKPLSLIKQQIKGQREISSFIKTQPEIIKIDPEFRIDPEPWLTKDLFLRSIKGHLPGLDSDILAFEDPRGCGRDRLYLNDGLNKIGNLYRKPRQRLAEAEIPIDCVLYSMRSFYYTPSVGSPVFSYCTQDTGRPMRGKKTPCMSKDYVYSVYNSYVDVMDCLDIPQIDMIPKLFNESGFHINTLAKGMDAGVGQLTGPAISSVSQIGSYNGVYKTNLQYHLEEMRASGKQSCARILARPDLFKPISARSDDRCNLINTPENPLRNILYTGIFYHYLLRSQTGITYSKGRTYVVDEGQETPWRDDGKYNFGGYLKDMDIEKKLRQAGIKEPNMTSIIKMMVTLGYNAGGKSALIFLDNYLKARIKAKLPVMPDDFDFIKDFDYQSGQFVIFLKEKDPQKEQLRKTKLALLKKSPFRGSFPFYLKYIQKSGTAGYLSDVAAKGVRLNLGLGEDRCTSLKSFQF